MLRALLCVGCFSSAAFAQSNGPGTGAGAGEAAGAIEPTPIPDPRAAPDPAAPPADPPAALDAATLAELARTDIASARTALRRAARSAPEGAARAEAVRLLGAHDPTSATARICARALRIDVDPMVRRSSAECLGRLGAELCEPHSPALVGALTDSDLDVITMAGWALANGGARSAAPSVAQLAHHEDPRVARLFVGYTERMRARLGLDFEVDDEPQEARDATGRRLVPPAVVLTTAARGLSIAAATSWLGLYGVSVGWLHGVLVISSQGGAGGAAIGPLIGLGGAALGAAAGASYGFIRADTVAEAHTVVQLGMAGTLAGFGTGLLVGPAPANVIAASNLSLLGTLGGTALGVALVEAGAVPTLGALSFGAFTGLTTAVGVMGVARAYLPSDTASFGLASLAGGLAATGGTLIARDQDLGLIPLAAGTFGMAGGAGIGAIAALVTEGDRYTESSGWIVLSGALVGASGGVLLGHLVPKAWDPMLSPEVRPDIDIRPPSWAFLDDGRGNAVPALVLSGLF